MMLPNLDMQLMSSLGALLCLSAYVGHQLQWLDGRKAGFNILNILGGGLLAYVALHPFQLGFVIMEVTWTLISIYGLIKYFRGMNK